MTYTYSPPEITEQSKKVAEKFFERAKTVAETRNFDYATELYRQGLEKDPEAVEQGHNALREIALRRMVMGGKKPGLLETMKLKTGQKDPLAAMFSAEYLLARDPMNITFAEGIVRHADRAELPETIGWALQVYLELAKQEKKLNVKRLISIRQYYEKLGDYHEQNGQPDIAVEYLGKGLGALELAIQSGQTKNLDLVSDQRNLAGKLTILRGKYTEAGDFRDSIRDADAQKALQDQGRAVKGEELLEEMIAKARAELEANPEVQGKITALVDLLLQRERDEDQAEAIDILERSHEQANQYSFKMRADDIRIRQRQHKVAKLQGQAKAKATEELADIELEIYKDRTEHYPTDLRLKFEYGRRLYAAKQFDEAIPVFQEAVADPRHGVRARYYIGTCFYQKGWHSQAISIINQALDAYEMQGDQLSKEMYYVLARAQEDADQIDDALQTYGKLVEWDFNYRDVRGRLDRLHGQKGRQQ